jgi:hypothetical protein
MGIRTNGGISMTTVQELIIQHRNRMNPEFSDIVTRRHEDNHIERHCNISNIKHENGWLEFDSCTSSPCIPVTHYHHKMHATIIGCVEILEE